MHDVVRERRRAAVTGEAGAAGNWVAQMIQPAADKGVGTQASFVRKTLTRKSAGGRERLYISAHGLYRCFINGTRVGDDLLTPGWTAYDKRLAYQVYDVGALLHAGENTVDIWLADGWYRSPLMWPRSRIVNTWGSDIAAIAELRASSEADAEVIVATDRTWQSGLLPILKSGIYFGEIYDARRENVPALESVRVLPFNTAILVQQENQPVRELAPIAPVKTWRDPEGRTVHDFGQNLGGYVAFSVKGEAGARVAIEHAEIVDHNGVFDRSSMRSAEARSEYVLKGGATEHYRPFFTFQGYRYARITITGKAEIAAIASVPISSVSTQTGTFTSANPLVNRLVDNTVWSQRSNFIDVPTDCPQRDERLGWTGDAQVFAGAACYLHNSELILRKWLRDVMADQRADGAVAHVVPDPTRLHEDIVPGFYGSTGWGDAICVVPWVLWQHYGDRSVLDETLPAMVRWVDFLWSVSGGPIVRPPRERGHRGFTFGDWLQPSGPTEKPLPTIGDDFAATLFLYISATLTAKAARVVGNDAVVRAMTERAEAVKKAIAAEFITPNGRLAYDDQTSYALAILHDLIPPELLPAVRRNFKATIARSEGRIGTGFIGTPALLPALIKIGDPELAAAVFLQEDVPGWLYQVKTGATTIWERWDAILPDGTQHSIGMNSFNHYAYGAVCQWLFEGVAGFRPDPAIPGFRNIIFEPTIIPELSPVAAAHDSIAGRVEAGWKLDGDLVTYSVRIPDDSTGILILSPAYSEITIDDQKFGSGGKQPTRSLLAAGAHVVTFRMSRSPGGESGGNQP